MNISQKCPAPSIFMDYNATTRVDERVIEVMLPYFRTFSNPHSSTHAFGWAAEAAVDSAREKVAHVISADPEEIIFTSGATESNNLAIKGIADFYREDGNHMITAVTEHKCALESFRALEKDGFNITYLHVSQDGLVNVNDLRSAITDKTILVSIAFANNEIGVIQPISEIGKICAENEIFFHTDAAQAFGKLPINVSDMNIDLMSISGHKIYGPMGIGALYVSKRKGKRVRLTPQISGGGQERGMRGGTVPTPLVVGLGKAAELAAEEMEHEGIRLLGLRNRLFEIIKKGVPDVVVNGHYDLRLAGNLNLSFYCIEGESIIMAIRNVAVSSGSACTSASLQASYVIKALGKGKDLEHSSIRFCLGRYTTAEEVELVGGIVVEKVWALREMSPIWEMYCEGIDLDSFSWKNS